MAAIDKIYGSNEQYDEFWMWAREAKPFILKWFYPKGDYNKNSPHGYDKSRPITNFPTEVDMWLLVSCPLGWVVERIKDQYGWRLTPVATESGFRRLRSAVRRKWFIFLNVVNFHLRRFR